LQRQFPTEFGCYSNHVVYVDESGDHGFISINKDYPVFVLAFCIFEVNSYINHAVPALESFKFGYFGHDQVILHESEIRRRAGEFKPLNDRGLRDQFMESLTGIINRSEFTLLSVLIDKTRYIQQHPDADNAYRVALSAGLPFIYHLLKSDSDVDCTTHVIFESRGAKEDNQLELDFLRICSGGNAHNENYPFKFRKASKLCNSSGLQIADLVARPIGRKYLLPTQENRAYDVLEEKFAKNESGKISGNIIMPESR